MSGDIKHLVSPKSFLDVSANINKKIKINIEKKTLIII